MSVSHQTAFTVDSSSVSDNTIAIAAGSAAASAVAIGTIAATVAKYKGSNKEGGGAAAIKDTEKQETPSDAAVATETGPNVSQAEEEIVVVGTNSKGGKGVTVVTKGYLPSSKAAKAGFVKVLWSNGKGYKASVVEKTMPDETVGGLLMVEGTGPHGKKGEAVVVNIVQTAGENIETSLKGSNQTTLVVKGTTPNGKKAKALVVRATWPNGAEGNAVVIKGTEPNGTKLGPLRAKGIGPKGVPGEAMFVKGSGPGGGQGEMVVVKSTGSRQSFESEPKPDYLT